MGKKNLTEGSIIKNMVFFALPFLLSNFLQAGYNLVDTYFIVRIVGVNGTAAANAGSQTINLAIGLAIGLSVGGTVIIGQFFGARDMVSLKKATGSFFCVMGLAGVVITLGFMIFSPALLKSINTPPEIMEEATVFLRIYSIGIFFTFGYNAIAGFLRGVGNSLSSLIFVLISALLNVGLDVLFMAVFGMGTAGAALATTISIIVSFAASLVYLFMCRKEYGFTLKMLRIDWNLTKNVLKVGFPAAVQSSIFNMSILVMNSSINSYGVVAATAYSIGAKIDSVILLPINAMGSACATMVAQNLGAEKFKRAEKTLFTAVVFNLLIALGAFIMVRMIPAQLFGIFDSSPEILKFGLVYLTWASFNYLFVSLLNSFNALATGAGNTVYPLCTTIMNGFVFRVPIGWFFQNIMGMGLAGVFIGLGFANVGGAIAGFIYYKLGYWRKSMIQKKLPNQVLAAETEEVTAGL